MERNLSETLQGETFQLFCRHSSVPYGAQLSNSASVRFNLYISISVYTVVCACVSCSFCCCVNHVQFAPCSQALMINAFIWTARGEVQSLWDFCLLGSSNLSHLIRADVQFCPPMPVCSQQWWCSDLLSLLPPLSFSLWSVYLVSIIPPFDFLVDVHFYFWGVSVISFFLFSPFSAVDHSGSVGSGQPLVNAMRTDSALIGGTAPFIFQHCGTLLEREPITPHLMEIVLIVIL